MWREEEEEAQTRLLALLFLPQRGFFFWRGSSRTSQPFAKFNASRRLVGGANGAGGEESLQLLLLWCRTQDTRT